jgi:hypothetical protein
VDSTFERKKFEEKIIANLVHAKIPQSENWIGNNAHREEIRNTGLWNVEHTDSNKILDEKDFILIRERINNTLASSKTSIINQEKSNNKIICFIPCCKSKDGIGGDIDFKGGLSIKDLPNTWSLLKDGRKEMEYCIDYDSEVKSAIDLYSGKLYSPINSFKKDIIDLINLGRLRLIIISAGYGILDAYEPVNKYEAVMSGSIASLWRKNNLTEIIADLLINENPSKVFGFFGGESNWYGSSSKYRYFFTEGLKRALEKGLSVKLAGCFYRLKGGGFPSFKELASLGNIFINFMKTGFDSSFVEDVKNNNWIDNKVVIGFDKIKR